MGGVGGYCKSPAIRGGGVNPVGGVAIPRFWMIPAPCEKLTYFCGGGRERVGGVRFRFVWKQIIAKVKQKTADWADASPFLGPTGALRDLPRFSWGEGGVRIRPKSAAGDLCENRVGPHGSSAT